MKKKGNVFWITGLPGAGKTTIGKQLRLLLSKEGVSSILIDGDEIRKIQKNFKYDSHSRLKQAYLYSNLCKLLSEQGHDVVCCTISLFHAVHMYNRMNIPLYKEIFLNATANLLFKRNKKDLYKNSRNHITSKHEVLGYEYGTPKTPDLVLKVDNGESANALAKKILTIRSLNLTSAQRTN